MICGVYCCLFGKYDNSIYYRFRERFWFEDEIVWIVNRVCSDVMKFIMNFRWYEGDNEKI